MKKYMRLDIIEREEISRRGNSEEIQDRFPISLFISISSKCSVPISIDSNLIFN